MCLITYTRQRDKLNFDHLEYSLKRNDDGFGVMFPDNGRLTVIKSLSKEMSELKRVLADCPENGPLAIHQRMKTDGAIDLERCHPYQVFSRETDGFDLYLMHNGILDVRSTNEKSDTQLFIENEFKPFFSGGKRGLFRDPIMQSWLAKRIGSNNKFLFMEGSGKIHILNRSAGDDGERAPFVWYSNTYSLPAKPWQGGNASGYGSYGYSSGQNQHGYWEKGVYHKWGDDDKRDDAQKASVALAKPNPAGRICVNGVWQDAPDETESGNVTERLNALERDHKPDMAKPRVRVIADMGEVREASALPFTEAKGAQSESKKSSPAPSKERGLKPISGYETGGRAWFNTWTVENLRTLSETEVFHEVIQDPEGATDFIRSLLSWRQ